MGVLCRKSSPPDQQSARGIPVHHPAWVLKSFAAAIFRREKPPSSWENTSVDDIAKDEGEIVETLSGLVVKFHIYLIPDMTTPSEDNDQRKLFIDCLKLFIMGSAFEFMYRYWVIKHASCIQAVMRKVILIGWDAELTRRQEHCFALLIESLKLSDEVEHIFWDTISDFTKHLLYCLR